MYKFKMNYFCSLQHNYLMVVSNLFIYRYEDLTITAFFSLYGYFFSVKYNIYIYLNIFNMYVIYK